MNNKDNKNTLIGEWVRVKKGNYPVVKINPKTGNKSISRYSYHSEGNQKGLVIGEIWKGSNYYNIKIVNNENEIFIIEVNHKYLEKTNNPLNDKGFGW